nr:unnamed protein product [Spirometra erinaceieuropaei]
MTPTPRPATNYWKWLHSTRRPHHFPPSLCVTIPPPQSPLLLNNFSQPGSRATDKLASDCLVWLWMHKGLKAWTRACLGCQWNRAQRCIKVPIGTFLTSDAQFNHVHLEILGPLPLFNGCSYFLICVDRFTRWPEAIPLPDITVPTVVKPFLSRWVVIIGVPSTITTDRGCTRIHTTAYHPAANAIVKRFYRQLKASLRAADDPENKTDHLPMVLLDIHPSFKSDLDCSVAELVFDNTVRVLGQMISPNPTVVFEEPNSLLNPLRQFMRTLSPVPPKPSVSESYLEKDLAMCSNVYIRSDRVCRLLGPPYDVLFWGYLSWDEELRIQCGTHEEDVLMCRLKSVIPDTPPDGPFDPLSPTPNSRPSIDPSRIRPLPTCSLPPTAPIPSSTTNSVTASHTHY